MLTVLEYVTDGRDGPDVNQMTLYFGAVGGSEPLSPVFDSSTERHDCESAVAVAAVAGRGFTFELTDTL